MGVNANANAKARPFRGGTLLLLKEVDDLMAVLALVGSAGDVDPVFAMGMLEDELVVIKNFG